MEKIKIEGLDKEVTRIALGTWAIGGWLWGGTEEKESIKTIHQALDKGINLLDTAPVYGSGVSEEIVGKAIQKYGKRDEIFIATKVGLEFGENIKRNSSKERIFKEVDDSLKRLKTDYIDIYQIHWPDEKIPFEETAEAMLNIFNEGKIRAIGVSNYSVEQMDEFRKIAPLHTNQPPYNLFEREIEKDILPYCKKNNIKILAYGAICRGLLSGKMKRDTNFEGDDLRKVDPKFQMPKYQEYLNAVERLDKYAQEQYGKNVIHLALRWILDKNVDVALWGARHPKQLDPVNEIWDFKIDENSMKKIDQILNETIHGNVGPEFMAPPK